MHKYEICSLLDKAHTNFWVKTANSDRLLRRGVFRPRTRPKTSLQCFALEQQESNAKHCRNVLGCVLGRKN